jgi:recombination protein RecT
MSIRLAATILVCRQNHDSPEILMVKRSRKAGFFPNAWVFPGGRVDDSDSLFPSSGKIDGLEDPAFAVAAIRECFEEAGVWLGGGTPDASLRKILNDRTGCLPNDGSLLADLDRIRQWSWWITPDTEPKRYDTRFFVCCLKTDECVEASQDEKETVEFCWIAASDAVNRHRTGHMFMAPPTYITLLELQYCTDVEEIWKLASKRKILPIQPVHKKNKGSLTILLPTHVEHPKNEPDVGGKKIVLEDGVWSLH